MGSFWFAAFVFWVVCGIATAVLASSKGLDAGYGFFIGFLLGPIGLMMIGFMPAATAKKSGVSRTSPSPAPSLASPERESAGPGAVEQALESRDAVALSELLDDSDGDVRASAESALVGLGDDSREALWSAARSDSWRVRARACSAIGKCGFSDSTSQALLVASLGDDARRVRTRAAEACGRTRVAVAADRLQALLSDPELQVREAAARALPLVLETPARSESDAQA